MGEKFVLCFADQKEGAAANLPTIFPIFPIFPKKSFFLVDWVRPFQSKIEVCIRWGGGGKEGERDLEVRVGDFGHLCSLWHEQLALGADHLGGVPLPWRRESAMTSDRKHQPASK